MNRYFIRKHQPPAISGFATNALGASCHAFVPADLFPTLSLRTLLKLQAAEFSVQLGAEDRFTHGADFLHTLLYHVPNVALIPGPVFVTSRFLVTSRYLYSTISTGVLSFGSCSDHRTLFCPLRWISFVCNSPWQPARLLRPVSASENLQAAMSPRDRCKRVKSPERNKESARLCSSVRNRTFHSALTKCT